MDNYDVVVIGFGKAGKTLAVKLAKRGKQVALIEKDAGMYGGTCINVGCIPSKRLITDAQNAPGSDFEVQRLYYENAIREKRQLTSALRQANLDKLVQAGVEVIDGTASFIDEHRIEVKGKKGSLVVEGAQIVINTGSVPVLPPIEGLKDSDRVYVSETIMDLTSLPRRLTIIGGGYIGLEFASMYANFGSQVTMIQDGDTFLPREDADVALCIRKALEQKGVKILTGARIERIDGADLSYSAEGEAHTLAGDAILAATGRRPCTELLHAQRAHVRLSDRGAVETDEYLRTSAPHIWAAGDVCGKLQFTYISLDDSRIILSDMLGTRDRTAKDRGAFSYSVFIDPPFSRVGQSEREAERQGLNYRVVKLPTEAIPKAKVLRQTTGMLKALIDRDTDEILGAALFCPESHEIINMLKLAMDQHVSYTVIRDFIFTHPTMAEGLNDLFSL